jgi:ferredoxin-NADP reductase
VATDANGKARFWKGALRVAEIRPETRNIRTYRLVPADGGKIPFTFSAGQFLNVSLLINGKKVNRSYTIATPPTRDDHVELTIKREERGAASVHVHDMLAVGNTIDVSAPAGRFSFKDHEADSVLLIAGGVGITPVMSILRDLTDRAWGGAIDLLFTVRTMEDIIFRDELKTLEQQHPNVKVHLTLTRDAPVDWHGLRGRITAEMLRTAIDRLDQRLCFICGPNEMAAAAREALVAAGVGANRIRVESFTPAAAVAMDRGVAAKDELPSAEPGTVTFVQSNQSAPLPGNKSILEVAESIGVSIDYDCRSGICGRCRVKLSAGDVTMDVQDALSDADIADGFILACQARSAGDVSVDA